MPDRAIRTAPTVEILHQLHGEGRGTFALFHYVWAQLHCTSARFHKRVRILDGDEEVWGRLFEPPTAASSRRAN